MRQLGVQRSHCADWNWGQTGTPPPTGSSGSGRELALRPRDKEPCRLGLLLSPIQSLPSTSPQLACSLRGSSPTPQGKARPLLQVSI